MNKPIRAMAVVCLLMFMGLLLNANYVQFVQADDLNEKPGNRRVIDEEFSRERGAIIVDGEPIAQSVPVKDRWQFQRKYTDPKLYAPVTGYFSYQYGQAGIERSYNSILSGSDDRLFVNRVIDLIGNDQPQGGSVELTLDAAAQKAAFEGLADLGEETRGAVVALNPQTGAVLAMVSQPTYNPNQLASHDADKVMRTMQRLEKDKTQPLTNRSTQTTLPPGSTFKIVTSAAAIEDLGLSADDDVRGGATLGFPGIGYKLTNQGGSSCGGNPISFERALQVSCNVSFGWLAGKVGQEKMADQAAKFGFGERPIEDLPSAASRFTADPDTKLEPPQLAQSGIGQFEVAATPLQMAMVSAAVANDGVLMKPHLVRTVRAPNLSILEQPEPQELGRPMSAGDARELSDMMVSVVDQGTGSPAAIPGIDVGGKTGTAESAPDRPPYAWFIGFAPADDPQVAVAVLVESAQNTSDIAGGRLGGPIARAVMEAVLR
ncbi:penicillin-binding protein 2 [Aeromicrobium sp. 636]|uniref:Penicillin-binding protein 2 n=1 Tax=Aeromicrobium senzhongii TaxID=2663859 RepID=A0A8I0EX70_9ACTN|nr:MULTISPECIES: penicillin-binding protein 2 [Aeromicrobium]MBC9227006.1 penicillin-binding protein 2 [Aeromicrobium senzhongii]MCQ3999106.1 penicillin-binding protein 2 [Aeromicrobium sp. 636]MTB89392.1 penicillin-binding protein 2 [Aeromicrobium senzhongii]